MFGFGQDFNALADAAGSNKEVRKGRYDWRLDEILETKSQSGAAKYEAKLTIVKQYDGQQDLVGTSRKQHFVVGHAKESVAKSYQAQFLAFLRACGVDLSTLVDEGAMYIAIKRTVAARPVVTYDVEPQEKDPKYLEWVLVKAGPATTTAPAATKAATVAVDPLFA